MKNQAHLLFIALAVLALSALNLPLSTARAQGTAFTYEGRLNNNGDPANGLYDFTFTLWNGLSGGSQSGPSVTNQAVGVTNGLFNVSLDFGPGLFTGPAYWLQIAVETNGVGPYSTLSPRQPLLPAPYAIYSASADVATSATTAASAQGVSAGSITSAGIASGQVVKTLNGLADTVTLAAGANVTITPSGNTLTVASTGGAGSGWSLTGNAGTTPGTDFLGTTDNNALEFHVNNSRLFRLEPNGNVVGGSSTGVDPSVSYATIAGGNGNTVSANSGDAPTIGGGFQNTVSNLYPTVSGGEYNHATANGTVVGGGYNNTASGGQATVAGGAANTASGIGAFIGGGGYDGTTQAGNIAGGAAAAVGGGLGNNAGSSYDTVPGGSYNVASGGNSFAAGHQAQALHTGAFVWADATGGAFQSTAIDQFSVRAEGGVRIVTGGAGMTLDGVPVGTGGGGGGSGWLLTGNAGANPDNGYFLGTIDANPLELRVNGTRALRLDTAGNVTFGTALNSIESGFFEATISGGNNNTNGGDFATISGGSYNLAFGDAATVGGGAGNMAQSNWTTISGGSGNLASGTGATVPGGQGNSAYGAWSFAAGQFVQALFSGTFIWGDGTRSFHDSAPNQFDVLATGGVNLETAGAGLTIDGQPVNANASTIPNLQVFDTPGTFQFVVPTGVSRLLIELWGGGGGGGDGYMLGTSNSANGSGGGGGGYGKGVYSVTAGTSYTVVVGVGGGSQQPGGTTSVGALISATGGLPGTNGEFVLLAGYTLPVGGSSSAPINITGATGVWQNINTYPGAGGSAGCGGSGGNGSNGTFPEPGLVPGGGGSGGDSPNEFYDGTGPAGGHGRVIIYY